MARILVAGAPSGCWSNLGDEAILAGTAGALRRRIPEVELAVVSSNPPGFLAGHGCDDVPFRDIETLAREVARADAVLLGGGSIFFDYWGCDVGSVLTPRHGGLALWAGIALLAAAHRTPVATYAVGVGPLASPDGELLTRATFELASRVTVRDEAAVGALAALGDPGPPPVVTADPALAVSLPAPPPADRGPRPWLGVALRHWDVGADPERWQAATAEALDRFVEDTGGTPVFVPFHRGVSWPLSDDTDAAEQVRARMVHRERTAAVPVDRPWDERAAVLQGCDAVLAMRYHAALFALAAGLPVVALAYDPKVSGLLAGWGLSDRVLDLASASGAAIHERLAAARAGGPTSGAVAAHRTREAANADAVQALLGPPVEPPVPGPAVRELLGRLADETDRPPAAAAALGALRRRRTRRQDGPGERGGAGRGDAEDGGRRVAILTNRVLDRETGQPTIGGAERYALELARLLRDLGLEPTFFQLGTGAWEQGEYFGFPVVPLPRGDHHSEFETGVGEAFFDATEEFDHVLYNAPNYAAGPMRDDAVVVCHGVWWDHEAWTHLAFRTPEWSAHLERVFSRPARVVSVDTNAINVVRALFPAAAARMTHVPNAVDTGEFHPPASGRADPVPLVLLPRRADVIRGPQLVGPILERIPDPCRFRWVGEGDPAMVDELRRVAARDGRLEVTTASFDEMPDQYRAADICVIPTIGSEGQSLACLEAMASGCAVVATRVGGLPELIDHDVDGLLCDPTPDALAAAVRRLVRDPALRRRLGAAARATAERRSLAAWRAAWAGQLRDLGWVDTTTAAVPYDVVCFSIIDWEFRWQRPQQLMARWAERGRRVFYVSMSRFAPAGGRPYELVPLGDGVWEVRLALPQGFEPHGSADGPEVAEAGRAALDALRADLGIDRAVSVVQIAGWEPLATAARQAFGWPVVYDCMDDWSTFPGFAEQPAFLAREEALVDQADVLVVSSGTILDRWIEPRPDLVLARNAADFGFFHEPVADPAVAGPDPLPDVNGPVAGFFGAVVEWFDQKLVEEVARARPDVTFVYVGEVRRVSVDHLAALPNVRFVGGRPYEELPGWLARFDVALVPFEVSPVTDGMDVVKFYEYLSQGTPVVSTPIREIVAYGDLLYLAGDAEEFAAQLDRALAEEDPALVARRIELARQHSWDERLDRIEAAVLPFVGSRPAPGAAVTDPLRVLRREAHQWRDATEHLHRELEAVHRSRAWKAANVLWRGRQAADRVAGRALAALRRRGQG